jgi:uncharacterized protein (DUF1778 family)
MKKETKTRRGRPPKGSESVRSIHLDMRIGPAEKATFKAAAELSGLDLSAWIRERLRQVARRELIEAGRQVPFLQDEAI